MLSYLNMPARRSLRTSVSSLRYPLPRLVYALPPLHHRLQHSSASPTTEYPSEPLSPSDPLWPSDPFSPSDSLSPSPPQPPSPPLDTFPPLPPLNILTRSHSPSFYHSLAQTLSLRQSYISNRFIFIPGRDMLPLLTGLGAHPSDLACLATVSNSLTPDPTLPYRLSRNGRFLIDYDSATLRRLESQPFTLTAQQGFKRHDSGTIRTYDQIQHNVQVNSFVQALFVFKALLIHGVDTTHRPLLRYDCNSFVCTLFNLRTFTNGRVVGEPALEGVHSDGVDHTMTTFLASENMTPDSAVTFMHDLNETTGIPFHQASPANLLARLQHRNMLDTLVLVDHERKHSLSPVHAADKSKEASRDMLLFFSRKPVKPNHVSGAMDSLKSHPELSMEIPIYVPAN